MAHARARERGAKDIRTMRARGKKENLNIDLCGAGLTSAQFVGSVELVDIPHIHMWHSRRASSTFLICPCYSISSQPIFPSIAPKRCISVYVCVCVCVCVVYIREASLPRDEILGEEGGTHARARLLGNSGSLAHGCRREIRSANICARRASRYIG